MQINSKKKCWDFNGIRTHGLCVSAADCAVPTELWRPIHCSQCMVGLLPFIIILFCCMYINVKLLERVIFFFLVFYIFDNSCFIDFYPIAEEFRHCNQGFTALGYCCNLKSVKKKLQMFYVNFFLLCCSHW